MSTQPEYLDPLAVQADPDNPMATAALQFRATSSKAATRLLELALADADLSPEARAEVERAWHALLARQWAEANPPAPRCACRQAKCDVCWERTRRSVRAAQEKASRRSDTAA